MNVSHAEERVIGSGVHFGAVERVGIRRRGRRRREIKSRAGRFVLFALLGVRIYRQAFFAFFRSVHLADVEIQAIFRTEGPRAKSALDFELDFLHFDRGFIAQFDVARPFVSVIMFHVVLDDLLLLVTDVTPSAFEFHAELVLIARRTRRAFDDFIRFIDVEFSWDVVVVHRWFVDGV